MAVIALFSDVTCRPDRRQEPSVRLRMYCGSCVACSTQSRHSPKGNVSCTARDLSHDGLARVGANQANASPSCRREISIDIAATPPGSFCRSSDNVPPPAKATPA